MSTDKDKRLFLVMGLSGAGKSSFINLLPIHPRLRTSGEGDLDCCTTEIGCATFDRNGLTITMVDTVGSDHFMNSTDGQLEDRNLDDIDAVVQLVAFLQSCSEIGEKVSGIIYVHRITDNRLGASAVASLKRFAALVGADAMKNVVFLTNRWAKASDSAKRNVHEANEASLKAYLANKIAGGAAIRCERLDDTEESGCKARALSILEFMVNDPLEIDVAVIQQLRSASGPNKFAETDLAKVINGQHQRLWRQLESQTGTTSTRPAHTRFADADDLMGVISSGALDAARAGNRIFGPYGVGKLGYCGGLAFGTVSAANLILAIRILGRRSDRSIRDVQKEIWGVVERSGRQRASAGAEKYGDVGGVLGGLAGIAVGNATSAISML